MALFSFIIVVISSFAFRQVGIDSNLSLQIAPGLLWIVLTYSAVTILNQTFVFEKENDALTGLLLTGVNPIHIYIGKVIVNFIFLFLINIVVLTSVILLFSLDIGINYFYLLLVASIVELGFIAIGTLFSAISVASRAREVLLPILLYPISLPLLIAGVVVCSDILLRNQFDFRDFWFLLIICYDLIALTLGIILFEYVLH